MSTRTENDHSLAAAVISAGATIAFQIGGKAARDALFLSNFPVTALPMVLVASALFSIVSVIAVSRAISTRGPGAVIPYAFGLSSLLLLGEWSMSTTLPRATAVLFYLHMGSFGAVLVSGFWSMIAELFDPRTAKTKISRIAAAATVGGILGGVMAERTGAMFSASAMLPVLAVMHLLCAGLTFQLRKPKTVVRSRPSAAASTGVFSGFAVLSRTPYLKNLAGLVFLATVAETFLDYALKTQASGMFGRGDQLIRFFGVFYTAVSVATFFVQFAFSRYSLQYLGLAGTISTMPLMVIAGGVLSLLSPGLYTIGFARGGESVLRSSLFRSGYELLYTPVAREEKRAAKTIVDVGFDRLGDAVGGGLLRVVLGLGLAASLNNQLLIGVAVLLGSISLLLTRRLGKGYVSTLERSLLEQAAELDLSDINEKMTQATILRTIGNVKAVELRRLMGDRPGIVSKAAPPQGPIAPDPSIQWLFDLRARDAARVRTALSGSVAVDQLFIASVIRLLARDDVSEDAVMALRKVAPVAVGQLTDALLNADEDFAVRRRVPRVLSVYASDRTVDGLLRGLRDDRFEVRFSCGRALAKVCSADETLRPEPEAVYAAAIEEIRAAERISEVPRMLDNYEDPSDSLAEPLYSTDIRLEHVFRILSLCLPREPLYVAFQALHTDDENLKGTALEYLESILPTGVREPLWQFLEGPAPTVPSARPADLLLEEMMQSHQRIVLVRKSGRNSKDEEK